jgi:protocatechuate 3,4-dioxygenase beta subunit
MKSNRRDFLRLTGLAGAATLIPFKKVVTSDVISGIADVCVLIPTETAGPFPLDLSDNSFFFRQDVREDRTGVQLNLKMKILGLDNCEPMQNVRVHIWHCDKDGQYSGYQGQEGLTYLRGWQMTDANGEVEFITILPGWYPGRVCHIHFQVYVSSMYAAISQLTFDVEAKNNIYALNPSIYTNGIDPVLPSEDGVFADGYEYQIVNLVPNSETNGYNSYLEVSVQGNGTTGIGYIEKQNAKQFSLGQNFPNPFTDKTTVPFYLLTPSDVRLELWNIKGQKLTVIERNGLPAGDHSITVNPGSFGIFTGNLVYQLEVRNSSGKYSDSRMMTEKR